MKHKFWVGQTGDEEFYEACDRHGVMVWQDFWLANPSDGPDAYFGLEPGRATIHSERGMPNVMTAESMSRMLSKENQWPQNNVWGMHDYTLACFSPSWRKTDGKYQVQG